MLRKIKVLRLWEPLGDPKGVLAGPGTPRDPPSNLFGPNRVAIWSFLAFPAPSCTEFRRGSRQGGPTPSISTFFFTFFGMIFGKMPIFGKKTLESCLVTADFRPAGRPAGAHGRPWAPHVLFLQGKTTKNIKNGVNGVEVAPFGLSLGRNGATGGAEPLGLLLRPILGHFFCFSGGSALGPRGPGPRGAALRGARSAVYTGSIRDIRTGILRRISL